MFSSTLQNLRRRMLDRLVLRPSREPIDPGRQRRVVLQSSHGGNLECFVQSTCDGDQSPDLLVVKFPGTAGRAERSTSFPADFFPDIKAEVWSWNPPGYGRSEGRASLAGIASAALDYWRYVVEQRKDLSQLTDSTRIWICGNSLGCATALHVAASLTGNSTGNLPGSSTERRSLGIVLRNPPPLIDVVKQVAKKYPLGRLVHPVAESLPEKMNAVITARQTKIPALFLQSELDTLVLPSFQQDVIDAYDGPKRFVLLDGLSHGCMATDEHEPAIRSGLQWLWEQTSE